jgi:type II secretory ATPase GspE/PulE/Tfp pilus assembly ATPase PilB-like protein
MQVTDENRHEISELGQGERLAEDAKIKQFEPLKAAVEQLIAEGITTGEEWVKVVSG